MRHPFGMRWRTCDYGRRHREISAQLVVQATPVSIRSHGFLWGNHWAGGGRSADASPTLCSNAVPLSVLEWLLMQSQKSPHDLHDAIRTIR
jgi:hypothetical protein